MKITKEEKESLEQRLAYLQEQESQSSSLIRDNGFKPAFCSGNNGFDDLPNFEIYSRNARLRREINELRDTLNEAEVEEVSTEEIGVGTKFVATTNLEGTVNTKKFILFGGVSLNFDKEFTLVSVNSPFGQAVVSKKVGDEFSYKTPENRIVSGVIDRIVSEKEIEEQPKQLMKK